jgi:hypothetical protein
MSVMACQCPLGRDRRSRCIAYPLDGMLAVDVGPRVFIKGSPMSRKIFLLVSSLASSVLI